LRILFIYQYFGTPAGSWSTRIYELTRRWVQEGQEVTVITSPYDKSDIKAQGLVSRQEIEGIKLIVIDSGDSNRFSKLKRVYRAIKFSVISVYFGIKEPADLIIASSGPITVAVPGLIRRIVKKTPFVFEVRDLWPLGGIVMGKIKNRVVQRLLLWFENCIYTKANKIVTCSDGQANNIAKRLGFQDKLNVIPNASDEDLFGRFQELRIEQRNKIGNKPYVIHLGSLGFIHFVSYIIESAQYLPNISFVLIGDGAERDMLEKKSQELGLKNVFFLGQMPKNETVAWLSNCELSLFTTLDNEIQDTSSPNKIFDSFAAGKPIIQTTRGWIKKLVEESKCGYNADPADPKDFANKIDMFLKLSASEKEKMSLAAKELSQTKFNRKLLAKRYLEILLDATN
jgi:glycosyltransferase involved in cell wall biosynthesis